jgi:acyl-CoA synthetase (AMP-forming)/AMP-acid ligase II
MTVESMLRERLDAVPPAVVIGDDEISYPDLYERGCTLAAALLAAGVEAGDRVATLLPNCREVLEALIATSATGAVFVPLNFRYRSHELGQVLSDCRPAVVLVDDDPAVEPNRTDILRSVIGDWSQDGSAQPGSTPRESFGIRRIVRVRAEEGFPGTYIRFIHGFSPFEPVAEGAARSGPAAVIYTSGTSAAPKGALVPEYALTNRQAQIAQRLGLQPDDRMYSPLPLFHIAGFISFLSSASVGATYLTSRYFDASDACAMIDRYRCRVMWSGFDTILRSIIEASELGAGSLQSLEVDALIGPPPTLQELEGRLPNCRLLMIYGATEMGSAAALPSPADELQIRTETSGFEFEGTETVIMGDDGRVLAADEPGEICARGPAVSPGYHRIEGPAARERFDEGGWYHSGDLGLRRSDGRIQYIARLTDLIKVGGENVAAAEIESFVIRHPNVREVQVVSMPDQDYGEVPVAFVQWAPGEEGQESDLRNYCEGRLSKFRIPKRFFFLTAEQWPRSATKIQKSALREMLSSGDLEKVTGRE